MAPAEYGDKSSLVVHIVTKSGLDQAKPTGSASFGYGSFKSPTGDVNIGGGVAQGGQLPVVVRPHDRIDSSIRRSSKRCTTPATSVSFFDRFDFHPSTTDTIHLNVQAAHSGFDVPNTYDQIAQTPAPGHRDVQRRARILARHRLEHAVHGERFRAPGSPDVSAERRIRSTTRRPRSVRIGRSPTWARRPTSR